MYCRRCGASLHQGVVICPECGARQRRGLSSIRCARCGSRVTLGLTVCPQCGRDVHPAGPRWALWLAGFAVVAVAALWGLGELPIERITTEVASIRTRMAGVVQFLGPSVPGTGAGNEGSTSQDVPAPTRIFTPTATPKSLNAEAVDIETRAAEPVAAEPVSPTEAATTATSTPADLATSTSAPTTTPSPTPTYTSAPEPTATPAPTETQPPAPAGPVTYKVRSGDTLSSIAAQFGIEWPALASANGLNSRSTLRSGQELVVPVAGAGAVAPAPAAPASTKYTVKSGDSLSVIATRYGITWQALAAANGLKSSSRLRIGQQLTIPGKGGVATPAATAASAPGTQSVAPSPAPAGTQLLPGPQLLSPGDQTPFSGSGAFLELVWSKVENLPPGAGYRVSVRWTEQAAPMEYLVPITTATSIRMPSWLFGKADQPARQYVWSVRVVRSTTDGQGGEKDVWLSPSSASRVLYWN